MRCYTCDGKKNSDCTKYETCKKDEEVILCFLYDVHVNYVNEQKKTAAMIIRVFVVRLNLCILQSCETNIKRNGSEIKKKCKKTKDCKAKCSKNEKDCTLCCVGDLCNKDQGRCC